MKRLIFCITFLFFAAYGQAQFRLAVNGTPSWSSLGGGVYQATVTFHADLSGNSYAVAGIVDTMRLFTGRGQVFEVDSVWGKTFSQATMRVSYLEGVNSAPVGQGMVYDPAGSVFLPDAPFGSTGATAQLNQAVVTYNALKSKGLIDSLVLLQDSILVAYNSAGSEVWRDTIPGTGDGGGESTTGGSGTTLNGSAIDLGGNLTANATITNSTFDVNFNLNSTGDVNFQDAGTTAISINDSGNLKLFQNGADATGTTSQRPSRSLILEGSSWNGSAELKNVWTIKVDSSNTQNNYPRLLGTLDGAKFLRIDKSSFSSSYNGIGITTIGYSAGAANTTGYNNSFLGGHSGEDNTTGYQNTFTGNRSGKKNTTGYQNTFTGQGAGYENTTGLGNSYYSWHSGLNVNANYNSFYGWQTGQGATGATGGANSFFGSSIAPNYTTATRNSASGRNALNGLTSGADNTANGFAAGFSNTTGSYNTYLGLYAGYTATPANANVSGNYNTFVGYQAGPGTATQLTNAMAFGYNTLVNLDNAAVFGNDITRIKVGINVASPQSTLHVQKGVFGGTYRTDEPLQVETASEHNYIGILSADGYSTGVHMGSATDNLGAYFSLNSSTGLFTLGSHNTTGQVAIVVGNGIEKIRINDVGSMGIGTTTPHASSILDLTTTSRGFLAPRMTVTQRNAIATPATGLQIYNTSTNKLNFYNGSAWQAVVDSATLAGYLPLAGGTLTGHLLFTDNTFDIGASGATRPRTGYFGTSIVAPTVNATTALQIGGTNTDNIYAKLNGNTGAITLGTNNTTPFHFETAGTRRFSIPSSGIANTPSSTKALVLSSADSLGYTTLQSSDYTATVTQSGSDTLQNSATCYGHFQRVGNYVTFTVRIEVALTSLGSANTVYFDPPIASNFTTAASDVIGVAGLDSQGLSSANTPKQRALLFASDSDDKIGISFDPVALLVYPENRVYISASGSYIIQ